VEKDEMDNIKVTRIYKFKILNSFKEGLNKYSFKYFFVFIF